MRHLTLTALTFQFRLQLGHIRVTHTPMDYQLITTTEALEAYCQAIADCTLVAIDTEFLRERTYYSKLCLIQIGTEKGHALIDPLADGISLDPLKPMLTSPSSIKIFHSGDQDIELFKQDMGIIPCPVFDTQIAGQALGFGDSIAYNNLVKAMLDVSLDKSQQYTHWDKRPLSEAQLTYALADVTHLLELTPTLIQQLKDKNRGEWLTEAHEALVDPARFEVNIPRLVQRIRHNLRKPQQLAALYALAEWREAEAMRVDKPRGFIIKDEVIAELARQMPDAPEKIAAMRLLTPIKNTDRQQVIVNVLDKVRAADPETYPTLPKRPDVKANNELVGLLSLVLKQRCASEGIAPKLIASRKDLEQAAIGRTDIPCMQGWRYEVFGQYAEKLVAGELKFHWDKAGEQVAMD